MTCLALFERLRESIMIYAKEFLSEDVLIFGYNMALLDDGDSSDPALFDVFQQMCPSPIVDESAAYEVAADFVDAELVGLRKVTLGHRIVADLRSAARVQTDKERPQELRGWSN
jgi:hypothetical protein